MTGPNKLDVGKFYKEVIPKPGEVGDEGPSKRINLFDFLGIDKDKIYKRFQEWRARKLMEKADRGGKF